MPNIAALFARALASHQAGRLAEAETFYKQVLALNGRDLNTLNNLGTMYLQYGRLEEGIRLTRMSLEINPDQPHAHVNLGNALKDLKRFDEALASYGRAIALKPDLAQAYYNRGNALSELGRLEDALADYDRAIARKPDYVEAYFNRGNALKELQHLDEALASYDRAITLRPNFAAAYYNRSGTLKNLKRVHEALADCDRVIALMPASADAHFNRGNALRELHRLDEAVASYNHAISLKPNYADAYNNLGNSLRELKDLDGALACYDRVIAISPNNADAYHNRGNVLQALRRYDEAATSYDRAMAIQPDSPYLAGSWLHSRMHCCQWNDLDDACAKLIHAIDLGKKGSTPFFFLAIPSTPALQQRCARIFIDDGHSASAAPLWKGERYHHDRIRIGYFSADFHNHATAHLMAELFERHDHSKFEIVAFSFGPPADDAWRQRLAKAFDRFFDVRSRSDREIAELARELEIDIAVDLKAHTQDARIGVFAFHPAPLQVSYLGYPGTTGANYIEYLIADHTLIPEEHQQYYDEKIVYLPHSYQPNDSTKAISDKPFSRAELGLPEHAFVFCSFNNLYKITPDLFDSWMRLLRAIEGSVLWLLDGGVTSAHNLRREAETRGVSPDRLVLAPRMELADHLARHRHADLFLDTFYYNAHTTASDALWAGLPVLTCLGGTFAGRVAGSLLRAVGLPELITRSHEEYEALAIELASDASQLAEIRTRLAGNRLTHPLFDMAKFAHHIEAAYKKMHERHQAGLPPGHIDIVA